MALNVVYSLGLIIGAALVATGVVHPSLAALIAVSAVLSVVYAFAQDRRNSPSIWDYVRCLLLLVAIFVVAAAFQFLLFYWLHASDRPEWTFGAVATVYPVAAACCFFSLAYATRRLLANKV